MIGKEQFELMKKGVYFVNTARGPVVEEDELLRALEYGMVAGAGLDVRETEPSNREHPLLVRENVALTPHKEGYSDESDDEMRSKAALGITDMLSAAQ